MFTIEGEYYCINGCLKYPACNKKIFNFIEHIAPNCNVEEAKYYKVSPDDFNYDRAMDGLYNEGIKRNFPVTADFPYTFISLDFYTLSTPCRLIAEFFDSDYYGISLLFNSETLTLDVVRNRIVIPFYRFISPIYGNNGVEKAVFSLNQIDATDGDMFKSDFMLNYTVCENINKKYLEKASSVIPIKNVGIYFPKQNKNISESIFHDFLQIKS